jgi:hypothetical protein
MRSTRAVYPVIFLMWKKTWSESGVNTAHILAQSQLFPQLHSLLSFIGQFLPVFLQLGLSAAKEIVHMAAIRIENRIFA